MNLGVSARRLLGLAENVLSFQMNPFPKDRKNEKQNIVISKNFRVVRGKLPLYYSIDIAGELLTCAIDAGFLPGNYRPQAKLNGGTIRLWDS